MTTEKKSLVHIYLKGRSNPIEVAIPYWSCVRLMAFFYMSKSHDVKDVEGVNILSLDTSVIAADFEDIAFIIIAGDLCGSTLFLDRVNTMIEKHLEISEDGFKRFTGDTIN